MSTLITWRCDGGVSARAKLFVLWLARKFDSTDELARPKKLKDCELERTGWECLVQEFCSCASGISESFALLCVYITVLEGGRRAGAIFTVIALSLVLCYRGSLGIYLPSLAGVGCNVRSSS